MSNAADGETGDDLRGWVARFARDSLTPESVARFVASVDKTIMEEIPALAADPILAQALHRSTAEQFQAFMRQVGHEEHRLRLPPEAVALAQTIARQDLDVGVLLKVYLVAHRGVFEFFNGVVDALGPQDPDGHAVLRFLWRRADLWMDESVQALIEEYTAERVRHRDAQRAQQAELIDAILKHSHDVNAEAATHTLGYALSEQQVAFVVWAANTVAADELRAVAEELASALGGCQPLTLPTGTRELWCWTSVPAAAKSVWSQVLHPIVEPHDLRVSLGLPAPGLTGFASSHREALAAQEVAMLAAAPPRVTAYREVELLCLSIQRRELLEQTVRREISSLRGDDEASTLIRRTSLRFLYEGCNEAATAAALDIPTATLRSVLARGEARLGHPINAASGTLHLALQYVEILGWPQEEDNPGWID